MSEIRQRLSWKIRISGWHFVIEEEGFKYRFKLIDNTFIKDRLHNKRIGTHYFEVKVDLKKTSSGYKAFSTVKSVSKSDFESSISDDWQDAFMTYISYCKAQLASNHKLNGKRRQFMKLIDEMGGENTLPSMMFLS